MLKFLQHRYALSEQGAKDLVRATLCVALTNIAIMFPSGLLYLLLCELLEGGLSAHYAPVYLAGSLLALALIAVTMYFQYNATFLTTYQESGVRRTTVAETLRRLPLSYFGKKDLADLTTNIMGDCARIETASSHWIPELFGALLSTTLVGLCLFAFDWRMALASFWVIPVALLIVGTTASIQKRAMRKTEQANLAFQDGVQETLEAMKDLRACRAEASCLEGLSQKIKDCEKQSIVSELTVSVYVSLAQMVLKLGIGTTALAGGVLFAAGELSVLKFFLFLMLVARLYDPMQIALSNFAAIIATGVQCERLDEVLSHEVQTGEERLNNRGCDIVFDHVSFSYQDGQQILSDVSFTAKQGQVTALIGPSGGGKTTVSRLAARFWDVDGGSITVGGMDISQVDPETLLSLYSIVFQDVTLFNNSVMENIRIGRKDATDEEVMEAARLAGCTEFIEKLPEGYATLIGENGRTLSGGERQRLSIARAFLKDAPIILLDEATASLDVENETAVQRALSALVKDKTVLIIAHRMRTIANADRIVVLRGGRVAEQGSPAELAQQDGLYRHMCELQTRAAAWKL